MKKAISLCLALMLCVTLAAPALAADPTSGKCGDNVTWSLSADGTLTISGTGPMYDYDVLDDVLPSPPWRTSRNEITSVVIEKGVTSIGEDAFCSMNLTSVTIPDSVTSIGHSAFYGCPLTSVTIPGNVTSIGEYAFSACEHLTSMTIPDSVTSIGYSAFSECPSLTSVTISSRVTNIIELTFVGCINLTSVIIPDSVTTIGERAFAWCESLTSVTIPTSVTSIKMEAFEGCNDLTDVYYGGSESQWKQISIDYTIRPHAAGNGNAPLLAATVHYNSAAPAPSTSGGVSVTVNGKAVAWTDAAPFIDANDRTMVPLRAVADAMGLTVGWDGDSRVASFTGGFFKTIYFPIDSTTVHTSGGDTIRMDTAAVIVNERTYAPIRYLAEYFGYTVGWDAGTRTVIITAG